MMTGPLADWRSIVTAASPLLVRGFRALEAYAAAPPDPGRYEVQGRDVYLLVQQYRTKDVTGGQFEAHRDYIDIQYVARGREQIGVGPVDGLRIAKPYDPAVDCALYELPDTPAMISLAAGQFAVLFPQDGHLPCRHPADGPCEVTKIVVKVRVD
jgi:YhcH/YjgK/YiaL family protein